MATIPGGIEALMARQVDAMSTQFPGIITTALLNTMIYTALGFGQAPRIGFPGAVAGRVRPHRSWNNMAPVPEPRLM